MIRKFEQALPAQSSISSTSNLSKLRSCNEKSERMALAMTPIVAQPLQDDTMDIDIDMDVDDVGPVMEDEILEV